MTIWEFIDQLPKNFKADKEVVTCDLSGRTHRIDTIELDERGNLIIYTSD